MCPRAKYNCGSRGNQAAGTAKQVRVRALAPTCLLQVSGVCRARLRTSRLGHAFNMSVTYLLVYTNQLPTMFCDTRLYTHEIKSIDCLTFNKSWSSGGNRLRSKIKSR